MAFNLFDFLTGFLSGLHVPDLELKTIAWLKEKGAEYPDLQERTDALAIWLETTIAAALPELDPTKMVGTLKGIASDIVNGTSGVDPEAWSIT